jgi:hypothetical protein
MLLLNNIGLILTVRSRCWDAEPPPPCDDYPSIAWLFVIILSLLLIRAHFLIKDKPKPAAAAPPAKPALPDIRAPITAIFAKHMKEAENWNQPQAKSALERAQTDIGNELTKQGFPAPPPPAKT